MCMTRFICGKLRAGLADANRYRVLCQSFNITPLSLTLPSTLSKTSFSTYLCSSLWSADLSLSASPPQLPLLLFPPHPPLKLLPSTFLYYASPLTITHNVVNHSPPLHSTSLDPHYPLLPLTLTHVLVCHPHYLQNYDLSFSFPLCRCHSPSAPLSSSTNLTFSIFPSHQIRLYSSYTRLSHSVESHPNTFFHKPPLHYCSTTKHLVLASLLCHVIPSIPTSLNFDLPTRLAREPKSFLLNF